MCGGKIIKTKKKKIKLLEVEMFSTNFSVIKMCILLLRKEKKKKTQQDRVEVEKQLRILV